jgi:hypothetical protein
MARLNVLFISAETVPIGEIPPEGVEVRGSVLKKLCGPFDMVLVAGRDGHVVLLVGKGSGADLLARQTEDGRWEIFREGGIWDSFAVLPAVSTPS